MNKSTTAKSEEVNQLIEPILRKYEKLGLINSALYSELKNNLKDQTWINEIQEVLNKVKDGKSIFSISKEITKQKNDQRVLEMFTEFDVAKRLTNTKFFGTFEDVEYLLRNGRMRQPDFLARSKNSITPVEAKLLSPQNLDGRKFFQKLIDKVNNHALKQLQSYYQLEKFQSGMIFVWSHHSIQLPNIQYSDLEKYFKKQAPKQNFSVTIICILSSLGLWDFYI